MNRITQIAKENQDRISNRRQRKNDKREDRKEKVENDGLLGWIKLKK